jgi:hypothetical protein
MARRWTWLFLVASALLAATSLAHASCDECSRVARSSSVADGVPSGHDAIVPLRHGARLIFAAPIDRASAPVVPIAPPSFVRVEQVSTSPAHLRSGPTTVNERGPPTVLSI